MMAITMLPAEDGDCLFIEAGGYRIVVDGGRMETGTARLPAFLSSLPSRAGRRSVDLLVLTHVDADHIEGLLALLRKPHNVEFEEVWFNGAEHHQRATGAFIKPSPTRVTGPAEQEQAGVLSIGQAIQFGACLDVQKIAWNAKFAGQAIMVEPTGALPRVALAKGIELVLLGPPRKKLADFYPEWKRSLNDVGTEQVLASRRRHAPTVENLVELAAMQDVADKTRPNGASIAFVLEASGKRILFTADAHPDDLAEALQRYGGAGPIDFDAIKVPHHGSARNNTSKFINMLRSPRWLISTDGSRHGHPDEEAIARIVLTQGHEKQLIFNYQSERNKVWGNPALQSHFGFSTTYGDGIQPVELTL